MPEKECRRRHPVHRSARGPPAPAAEKLGEDVVPQIVARPSTGEAKGIPVKDLAILAPVTKRKRVMIKTTFSAEN